MTLSLMMCAAASIYFPAMNAFSSSSFPKHKMNDATGGVRYAGAKGTRLDRLNFSRLYYERYR